MSKVLLWVIFILSIALFIILPCVCFYFLYQRIKAKEHTKFQWAIILSNTIFVYYQGFLNFYVELATCSIERKYLAEISALKESFQFTNMELWSLFLPFLFFIICSKSVKEYFSVAFSYSCLLIVSATICFQIIPDKIFRLFLYQYQAKSPIPHYLQSFVDTSYGICSQFEWLFFMIAMIIIGFFLWAFQIMFTPKETQHYW